VHRNRSTACTSEIDFPPTLLALADEVIELGLHQMLHLLTAGCGRFCCKSSFALVIKIYFGCTRDFRVKMWGTSSPDDKLTDDLGNAIEGTRISGRRWIFFSSKKLAPGDLGLLQQYRH
jgi:hypothetical protein